MILVVHPRLSTLLSENLTAQYFALLLGQSQKLEQSRLFVATLLMNGQKIISRLMELFMQFETQKLIIELLNQELKKANRIPTLAYHKEIQDAKKDFITYMIKNCSKR